MKRLLAISLLYCVGVLLGGINLFGFQPETDAASYSLSVNSSSHQLHEQDVFWLKPTPLTTLTEVAEPVFLENTKEDEFKRKNLALKRFLDGRYQKSANFIYSLEGAGLHYAQANNLSSSSSDQLYLMFEVFRI